VSLNPAQATTALTPCAAPALPAGGAKLLIAMLVPLAVLAIVGGVAAFLWWQRRRFPRLFGTLLMAPEPQRVVKAASGPVAATKSMGAGGQSSSPKARPPGPGGHKSKIPKAGSVRTDPYSF
jgi:hypothetical protein